MSAFSINLVVNLEPVYGIILALINFRGQRGNEPGILLWYLLDPNLGTALPVIESALQEKSAFNRYN